MRHTALRLLLCQLHLLLHFVHLLDYVLVSFLLLLLIFPSFPPLSPSASSPPSPPPPRSCPCTSSHPPSPPPTSHRASSCSLLELLAGCSPLVLCLVQYFLLDWLTSEHNINGTLRLRSMLGLTLFILISISISISMLGLTLFKM